MTWQSEPEVTLNGTGNVTSDVVSLTERAVEAVILTAICIFALVGNVSFWAMILRDRKLRSTSNWLFLCLSAADVLVSALNMPIIVVTIVAGSWIFSNSACVAFGFITMVTFVCSVMSLGVISINRYVMICRPNVYQDWFTERKTGLMIAGVWLFSAGLALPPLVGWGRYDYLPGQSFCFCDWKSSVSYTLFMVATCFGGPCSVMTFCYVKILKEIGASKKRLSTQSLTPVKGKGRPDRATGSQLSGSAASRGQDGVAYNTGKDRTLGPGDGLDGTVDNTLGPGGGLDGTVDNTPDTEAGAVHSRLQEVGKPFHSIGANDGSDTTAGIMGTEQPGQAKGREPDRTLNTELVETFHSLEVTNGPDVMAPTEVVPRDAVLSAPNVTLTHNDITTEENPSEDLESSVRVPVEPDAIDISVTAEETPDGKLNTAFSSREHEKEITISRANTNDCDLNDKDFVIKANETKLPLPSGHLKVKGSLGSSSKVKVITGTKKSVASDVTVSEDEQSAISGDLKSTTSSATLLARQKQHSKRRKEEVRLATSFAVVIVVFVISWLPFCVTMFMSVFMTSPVPRIADMATLLLGCFNSCCNPIIYGVTNRKFREGYRKLFAPCFSSCSWEGDTTGKNSGRGDNSSRDEKT